MENEKKENSIEEKNGQPEANEKTGNGAGADAGAGIAVAPEIKANPEVNAVKEAEAAKAEPAKSGAPVQAQRGGFGGARRGGFRGGFGGGRPGGRPGGGRRGGRDEMKDEYDQKIIDIARVTRVMAGGKRMRFRACVAIGNKAGTVGIGVAKGADVSGAVTKAVNKAKKNLIKIKIVNDTIPHEVRVKVGAAKLMFKPAKTGRGVIAGGAVRAVIELAGIKNIVSKILGTNNKLNNVKCAIEGLRSLKYAEPKAVPAKAEKQ
ncbi:MAG: 30S ribosomal protein S5 [Patescibacteria group bacterium]|jgi:small subunit ribosomal protein S5